MRIQNDTSDSKCWLRERENRKNLTVMSIRFLMKMRSRSMKSQKIIMKNLTCSPQLGTLVIASFSMVLTADQSITAN
jgi:hypothetical protein